jgi:hypothetical protein
LTLRLRLEKIAVEPCVRPGGMAEVLVEVDGSGLGVLSYMARAVKPEKKGFVVFADCTAMTESPVTENAKGEILAQVYSGWVNWPSTKVKMNPAGTAAVTVNEA